MDRFAKRTIIIALIAAVALHICACSKYADAERAGDSIDRKPMLFGATYMTMNNPFFDVLNDSIKEVVESNGDILLVRDPANDQQKQNSQISDMIEEGISVLFLNPVDRKGVKPALQECRENGVSVINVDTMVYDREYTVSGIESDNYGAGVLCAKDMMGRMESARIVIFDSLIMESIIQREKGFCDTIAPYPQYEIVYTEPTDGLLEKTTEAMSRLLETGIEFNVVLGGNDPTALGALAALQQHNRDQDVTIYGIDGSPDFKKMLSVGLVAGTSMQSPQTIGAVAAETAYRHLAGEKVDQYISIPVVFITEANLDQFEIAGWQ